MTVALEAAFLAAITETPDDDTPRLVYADWLEEHGQSDRAEFIRVQCELAKMPAQSGYRHRLVDTPELAMPWPDDSPSSARIALEAVTGLDSERAHLLRRREQHLKDSLVIPLWSGEQPGEAATIGVAFERGFASAVHCDVRDWLAHGRAICLRHPVAHVAIDGKRPGLRPNSGAGYDWLWWHEPDNHGVECLPLDWWELLPARVTFGGPDDPSVEGIKLMHTAAYPSEAAALAALSAAALAWARAPEPC